MHVVHGVDEVASQMTQLTHVHLSRRLDSPRQFFGRIPEVRSLGQHPHQFPLECAEEPMSIFAQRWDRRIRAPRHEHGCRKALGLLEAQQGQEVAHPIGAHAQLNACHCPPPLLPEVLHPITVLAHLQDLSPLDEELGSQ
eukprot:3038155-Heterocapsa_arctica.AAC.1